MRYTFPEIRTIEDVLPHIEGHEEFIISKREGYTVINYTVATVNTFNMTGPDDIGGAIRRECRGLIFNADGVLISRPFHKFFNVNEREETQSHCIDVSTPHVIMEKMDGSMIRPILIDNCLRLGTKMGITDVSADAEAWLAAQNPSLKEWMIKCVRGNVTPIFEWVSPSNQIVLYYKEEGLVYLGSRDNTTGEYTMDDSCPFSTVPCYGSIKGNIADYINRKREEKEREGDVIRFGDGHMLKIKNDWYVRIHRTIDRIKFDRNVVDMLINESIDDAIAILPSAQVDHIRSFEISFWEAFAKTECRLSAYREVCESEYKNDRKRIALELVPYLKHKADAQFIFRMLDGQVVLRPQLLDYIRKNISSNAKWDACAEWMSC